MKNIFSNKKKTIIFFTVLFLLFLIFNIFTQLTFYGNRMDFYWNYSFGLQITNGLLPYSGYNMVPTPLLAFSTALFLKIFGNCIVSYVVFMSILKIVLISLVSYLASKLINKNTKYDKYYVFIISFILLNLLLCNYYFEYNFFVMIFLLLIILLEINIYKNKKDTKLNNMLVGFLAALTILSKQSIGLFICIFVVIKPLLFNKDNKIKDIIFRIIGIFIPCLIFLIYLLVTNTFDDFINYAVIGIKEFNNSYTYITFLCGILQLRSFPINLIYFLLCLSILTIILLYVINRFYLIIKSKNKHFSYVDSLVFFYSLSALSCMYPISDLTHLFPAIMPISALLIVSSYNKYKVFNKIPKKYNTIFITWLSIIVLIISLYPAYKYFEIKYSNDNKTGLSEVKYVILDNSYGLLANLAVSSDTRIAIDAVIEYEKENDCLILDSSAAQFHLVNNKYYKDYDLFMRGNFGENGEDRLIKDLDSKENIKLLISYDIQKDIDLNRGQIPEKVINYVFDNYEKVDRVAYFDVFERKDK